MRSLGFPRLVGALAAIALAGCAGTAPRKDNDVRVAIYSEPSSLSLIGNTDVNSNQIASLISDGLVAYDAQMKYIPMIAASWELAPDGTAVTFHLRDGALWHDGERVTSKDVVYTIRKIRDPATQARSWVSSFADVVSVETPDDLTVVVRYSRPYADALEPWRVPLIPEHAAAKDSDFLKGDFARHPIGCGPFRFVSHDRGQGVVLEAFDRYWGGRPAVDHFVFKFIASERTGYETLLLRDLDLIAVPADVWRESLVSASASRLARFVFFPLRSWRVDWNQTETVPFFRDKGVRRAMLLALDRQRFATTVFAGLARPSASSYPPESPWADPTISAIPYDPALSRRLLESAGWRLGAGSVREKDGVPFTFTLLVSAGSQEITDRIAAWMQQSLSEVGVSMKIEKIGWETVQQRRKSHQFDAAMTTVSFDATPDRFDLFHSSARDGGFNYGGFSDAEVDRLLEDGRRTLDPTARKEIYDRLQRRLDDLQPIGFLFQLASPVLHDPDLLGVVPSGVGLFQFAPGPRAWHWSGSRTRL